MAYGRYVFILQPEYGRIAQFLTDVFFLASKQKLRCTLGLHIWWWFTFLCLYIIYIGFAGLRKYSLTGHEPPEPMKKYSDHIYIYIYILYHWNHLYEYTAAAVESKKNTCRVFLPSWEDNLIRFLFPRGISRSFRRRWAGKLENPGKSGHGFG